MSTTTPSNATPSSTPSTIAARPFWLATASAAAIGVAAFVAMDAGVLPQLGRDRGEVTTEQVTTGGAVYVGAACEDVSAGGKYGSAATSGVTTNAAASSSGRAAA